MTQPRPDLIQLQTKGLQIYVNHEAKGYVEALRAAVERDLPDATGYFLNGFKSSKEQYIAVNAVGYISPSGKEVDFDPGGNSALHLAQVDPVWDRLIQAGAEVEALNKLGMKPTEVRFQNEEMRLTATTAHAAAPAADDMGGVWGPRTRKSEEALLH